MRGLITLVSDIHVDNCLKETLAFVYCGSIVNNRPQNSDTVEPRYLELAYLELPLISKRKSGPCFNMKL